MTKVFRPFTKDPSIVEVLGCEDCARLPELPGELLERSDRIAWLSTVRVLGLLLVLASAAPLVLAFLGWPGVLVLAVLLGMQFHKLTILLHECIHGTFFATRRLNLRIGVIAAALAGTTYRGFQHAHLRHHRHNGSAADPEGEVYPPLGTAPRSRLVYQLLSPLLPLAAWRAVRAQVEDSRERSARATAEGQSGEAPSATRGGRAIVVLALAQIAMALLTSWAGQELWLAPFYQVTAVTFGLFFSRLRGFCEHVPPSGWDSGSYIRTHKSHWLERHFLYDLGMNWHLEHHLYPTVPGYRLLEVNRQLSHMHTKESCGSSMIMTILRLLKAAPA